MSKMVSQLRQDAMHCATRLQYSQTYRGGFTRQQYSPRRLGCRSWRVRSSIDKQETAPGDEELLLRDIERYKQREQMSSSQSRNRDQAAQVSSQSGGNVVKDVLDKVLIADFFFVCAALAWLVAGVGAKTLLSNSALIDAWFPLWQWVFQPAIGTLMLGALVSGAVGQLHKGSDKGA